MKLAVFCLILEESPPIERGQSLANVSQRDGEVDRVLAYLSDCVTTCYFDPVIVGESNLLSWIVNP